MVSKEEFLHLFDRFVSSFANMMDMHEAVAITTGIQEEIFSKMEIDPQFGLACLGKINMTYESDRDLMIRFYEFVAKEEMACEEAELGPDRFAERLMMQQNLQEQQLEMLKYMHNFQLNFILRRFPHE
ncbi:uncharacterized protein LOC125859204 [Solanum stenotomum]|uniref:uncharacterized protein LOC125859204 n=1 Tax=Solanum stenotomum TaxID=172797 RepID=UPI0020D19389|nr:uncharacterized protein LOC125859204 [Solanum stenotomum]